MDAPKDPRHPANHGNRTVESGEQADIDLRRSEQAHQMDEVAGPPTTPALPRSMAGGMAKGAVLGGIIGAIVLTPLALADILELDLMVRLVIVWIAGAAAGATLGAVFFGGADAEKANPENDEYVYADGPGHDRRQGPGLD